MKNIQKISKIIAIVFVIAGLVLILGKQEWFPEFYRHKFSVIFQKNKLNENKSSQVSHDREILD